MTVLPNTDHALQRVIQAGLLLAVVVTALAHGVVEPWSALLFQWLVTVLFLLWAFKAYRERWLTLFLPDLIWPLLAFIGVGVAQSISWVDGQGIRRSLSYDVEATRGTVLMLLCLLICVLLAGNVLNRRADWQMLAKVLPVYGMILAILAILQHFSMRQHILWLREITTTNPFGTFVNRDHFAGYMELLIGFPVALIATQQVRGEGRFLYIVAAVMMGLAVLLTLSRGGTISILLELLLIGALASRRARHLKQRVGRYSAGRLNWLGIGTVTIIFAGIIAGILWIGAEPIINRFATGNPDSSDLSKAQSFENARGTIWRDTWLMIRANPVLGVGLGAYETAFPIYALDENESGGVVAQSHNDFLQVLADTGIAGGLILVCFLYLLLRAILSATKLRDPLAAGVALGCGGGMLGMLVHSFFDFNLQLVSHALLFLILGTVIFCINAVAREQAANVSSVALVNSQSSTPELVSEVMS